MIRTMLVLLALVCLCACANPEAIVQAEGACEFVRVADVPIESRGNMLFTRARINDQPVELLVDTGAERTLLTEAAVNKLGLPRNYQRATRTFGIGTSSVEWNAKLPTGLVLGGTRFPIDDVTVGHFDISEVAGGSADGLLGVDVLLAFDVDLDVPERRMILYRPRPGCPDALPPWHRPYVAINGVSTRRDRVLVPFQLDGVDGMGVLDTGAQMSSISTHMAERVGLADADMASDRLVVAHGAAPEQVEVHMHRFRDLRIGLALVHAPALPVVPMSSSMGDALVGGDFLHGRRVWLSLSTHRVFVTPLEEGPWIAVTGAVTRP